MSYSAEKCLTFLCPMETDKDGKLTRNESVGLPIARGNEQEFEGALKQILKDKGSDFLKGSVVYVAGVDLREEKNQTRRHQEVIDKLNLSDKIRLKVISLPKEELQGLSVKTLQVLWARTVNWFPSLKKDYEIPRFDEVLAGLTTAALIEVGNVYYLWKTLPPTDAYLTLLGHASLLTVYAVYSKMFGNWLLRPGSSQLAFFLKQVAMAMPYVVNYNIFGNFTPLMEYLRTHTAHEAVQAFPAQLLQFASSQSMTLLLQVVFYSVVINSTIINWMNSQPGVERSNEARVWSKVVQTPVLMLNAVAMSMAAGAGASTLLSMGSFDINSGHAFLLLLSGFGYVVYRSTLDKSLDLYLWTKRKCTDLLKNKVRRS